MKRKKFIIVFFILCSLLFSGYRAKGWKQLFNGKDLTGWTVQCRLQDRGKIFWIVENGAILCNSIGKKDHNHVWLVTDNEFEDFELHLTFLAYRDSPGNCGLQFRSRYDTILEGGRMNGPQVDIHPPEASAWRTGLIYDETVEEQRWLVPSLTNWNIPQKYKPEKYIFKYSEDGWNDLTLICRGMHITTIVNGITRTDWDGTEVLGNEAHRKHNIGRRGHLALQLHQGDELKIRFRDIRIRELTPEKREKN